MLYSPPVDCCRYIKWIEQSYAKSDKGSSLCAVLERAVQQFVDDKSFYDDPRYVDMWIKLVSDSLEYGAKFGIEHVM